MKFSILLVDNDDNMIAIVKKALLQKKLSIKLDIKSASTYAKAEQLIKSYYFHLAIVDLHLSSKTDKSNIDGLRVLRFLAEHRPSCKRVLCTKYLERHNYEIAPLLDPNNSIIEGIIDKRNFQVAIATYVESQLNNSQYLNILTDGSNTAYNLLNERIGKKSKVRFTDAEFGTVVRDIIGRPPNVQMSNICHSTEKITTIKMELLEGGRSRSVVLKAELQNKEGRPGIACVLKIGIKADIIEEYYRYIHFVKYILSKTKRVELLGFAAGDVIGGICYSFAGDSMKSIDSIETFLKQQNDSFTTCVNSIFDPNSQEWYARRSIEQDLAKYFSVSYDVIPENIRREMHRFIDANATRLSGQYSRDGLKLSSGKCLSVPDRVFGLGVFRGEYNACIVHGDLNVRNILVSVGGQPNEMVLIDYRHTNRGPAAVDFAAIETSIRESDTQSPDTPIIKWLNSETLIWKSVWKTNTFTKETPFWMRASYEVGRLLRTNFPTISESEYASTCLLWACRLFRIHQLPFHQRVRLFVWISFLNGIIEKNEAPLSKTDKGA